MAILTKSKVNFLPFPVTYDPSTHSDLRPQVKRRLCCALSLSSCKVSSAFWMWPSDSSSRFLTPRDGGSRLRARRGRHSSVLPPTGVECWWEGEEQSFQNTQAYAAFKSYRFNHNYKQPNGKNCLHQPPTCNSEMEVSGIFDTDNTSGWKELQTCQQTVGRMAAIAPLLAAISKYNLILTLTNYFFLLSIS